MLYSQTGIKVALSQKILISFFGDGKKFLLEWKWVLGNVEYRDIQ
jgi:hypothetical protein